MTIDILTLFPQMIATVLSESILGRALRAGLLEVRLHDIREYTLDRHRKTDDYPFGGGAGMVMMAQPVVDAFRAVDPDRRARRIYLSPRGRTLDQRLVEELSREEALVLLCGHYEGVDQRALDACVDEEVSIGDYVLTGGELGAMVVVDAVARLLPGVLGSSESAEDESFTAGLLEYPQYTRPADFRGETVPQVLLEGNHADITAWRRERALQLTWERRPDLLPTAPLSEHDLELLERIRAAEEAIRKLAARDIPSRRRDLSEADLFERKWLTRFVAPEELKQAKKLCLPGRRHKGGLELACVQGFARCERGEAADLALLSHPSSEGYLFLPEKRVLLAVQASPEALLSLDIGRFVWVDERWERTYLRSAGIGDGAYFCKARLSGGTA